MSNERCVERVTNDATSTIPAIAVRTAISNVDNSWYLLQCVSLQCTTKHTNKTKNEVKQSRIGHNWFWNLGSKELWTAEKNKRLFITFKDDFSSTTVNDRSMWRSLIRLCCDRWVLIGWRAKVTGFLWSALGLVKGFPAVYSPELKTRVHW